MFRYYFPSVDTEKLPPTHKQLYYLYHIFSGGMAILSIAGSIGLVSMGLPISGVGLGIISLAVLGYGQSRMRRKSQSIINQYEDAWKSPFEDDDWDEEEVDRLQ